MDDLIDRMKEEEAKLMRRLDAVRAFMQAYADDSIAAEAKPVEKPASKRGGPRTSEYSEQILAAAGEIVDRSLDPVPTRDLVTALEAKGIEIRGQDKSNALSALLSRNSRFHSNGRIGWTLVGPYKDFVHNEIGALNGHAVSAPSAEEAATSSIDYSADDLL